MFQQKEIVMDNAIDYASIDDIKKMIRRLDDLQAEAQNGNMTAAVIRVDILDALDVCTHQQKTCIDLVLIQGYTLSDAAASLDVSLQAVAQHINAGARKMSDWLIEEVAA